MNYEETERYLHNGMTEDERKAFELAMAGDPELAAAVDLYRKTEAELMSSGAAGAGAPLLAAQLSALNKQYFSGGKQAPVVQVRKKRWLYYTGAAAAVLLAFVLVRPLLSKEQTTEQLYADNAKEFYRLNAVRSGSAAGSDGAGLYESGKYKEALAVLEPVVTNNTDTLLAVAVCHQETGNSSRALEIYNRLEAADKTHTGRIRFFKALFYLKQGDKAACRQALEAVPQESEQYDAARALLKKL